MTPEEHKARHIELHKAMDELLSDYMRHHPNQVSFMTMPLEDLLLWSYQQTLEPEELPPEG